LGQGQWQISAFDQPHEPPLELGVCERECPTIENLAKGGHASDARVIVNR
jgi:hypothetical protein